MSIQRPVLLLVTVLAIAGGTTTANADPLTRALSSLNHPVTQAGPPLCCK